MTDRTVRHILTGLARIGGFGAIGTLMAERNFRIYTISHAVNLPGLWIYRVALAWLTWDLTHSGTWLGLVAAADALPGVFIGPLGGVLADRLDRRKLALITQAIQLAFGFTVAVLTLTGLISIASLFLLTLLRGINVSFWQPVRLTLVPALVPREQVGTAIALHAAVFNTAFFIGPALAGPLILLGGPGLAFSVDVATSTVFMAALLTIHIRPVQATGARRSVLAEVGEGLAFIARHRGLGPLLLLTATASLTLRPVTELLAGFTDLLFAGGAGTLSAFTAALGFGALVGAVWVMRGGDSFNHARQMLIAGLISVAAVAAFIATGIFPIALIALAFAGYGFSVIGVLGQTLAQHVVPDGMRGRVLSIHGLLMRGGPGIGALAMGAASDTVGLRLPLLVGILVAAAVYTLAWTRRRRFARALADGPAPPPAVMPAAER